MQNLGHQTLAAMQQDERMIHTPVYEDSGKYVEFDISDFEPVEGHVEWRDTEDGRCRCQRFAKCNDATDSVWVPV